ncbi:hypothetical protein CAUPRSCDRAFT_13292, partial [Caulochytrium protostelioides]
MPTAPADVQRFRPSDFIYQTGLDRYNMVEIENFLQNSRLPQKLKGYMEKRRAAAQAAAAAAAERDGTPLPPTDRGGASNALLQVTAFLSTLQHPDGAGILLCRRGAGGPADRVLRYLCLDAARHITDVARDARCVILAGGTLAPVSTLVQQLFADVPDALVARFACDHVVPATSILTTTVGEAGLPAAACPGERRVPLTFTHGRRSLPDTVAALGRTIGLVCENTPGGVVVMLPSYSYMEETVAAWRQSGLWDALARIKPVFMEPREAQRTERVLA